MIRYVDTFEDRFAGRGHLPHFACDGMWGYHCRDYRAAKIRPPSARALSDELLGGEMLRLHTENYGAGFGVSISPLFGPGRASPKSASTSPRL